MVQRFKVLDADEALPLIIQLTSAFLKCLSHGTRCAVQNNIPPNPAARGKTWKGANSCLRKHQSNGGVRLVGSNHQIFKKSTVLMN